MQDSIHYSDSGNGWDVTIYWEYEYGDSTAYMWWEVAENRYGRTFNVVDANNTSTRYNSGTNLAANKQYYFYVYKSGNYSQSKGPFTLSVPDPPTYTVSYNANGGTGAPGNQTKTYGVNLALSSTKPTRPGHTFKEWNTSKDGKGTTYRPGETYTKNAALTLYAIWIADTYAVTYNANGGTGAPDAQTKVYDVSLKLSDTVPERTGYTFKNWNTASDGSGTSYSPGSTYTSNAALALYAIWTANTYIIKYHNNGGSGSMSDQSMTYDSPAALRNNAFSRAGHTFIGWATTPGGAVLYQNGQTVRNLVVTNGGTITLYAVWSINSITISFNASANGGTTPEASRVINYGAAISTLPVAEKQYYKFVGWFTTPNGGSQVTAQTVFTADATIYAQFVVDSSLSINVAGSWRKGIPYVKVSGVWKKGYAWVKNGSWKQGIG